MLFSLTVGAFDVVPEMPFGQKTCSFVFSWEFYNFSSYVLSFEFLFVWLVLVCLFARFELVFVHAVKLGPIACGLWYTVTPAASDEDTPFALRPCISHFSCCSDRISCKSCIKEEGLPSAYFSGEHHSRKVIFSRASRPLSDAICNLDTESHGYELTLCFVSSPALQPMGQSCPHLGCVCPFQLTEYRKSWTHMPRNCFHGDSKTCHVDKSKWTFTPIPCPWHFGKIIGHWHMILVLEPVSNFLMINLLPSRLCSCGFFFSNFWTRVSSPLVVFLSTQCSLAFTQTLDPAFPFVGRC